MYISDLSINYSKIKDDKNRNLIGIDSVNFLEQQVKSIKSI